MTFLFEIMGTIAFAVVGAATAIEKKLDLFGVLFISVISAVGGGIIRDIVLGNTPPNTFKDPIFIIVSLVSAIVTILAEMAIAGVTDKKNIPAKIIDICDAMGLSVFTISGINVAIGMGAAFEENAFLLCFTGLITSVGGGMLRDIFIGRTPAIFRREIYAMASIIGSIIYISAGGFIGYDKAGYAAVICIFIIRMISLLRKVDLPIVWRYTKHK